MQWSWKNPPVAFEDIIAPATFHLELGTISAGSGKRKLGRFGSDGLRVMGCMTDFLLNTGHRHP